MQQQPLTQKLAVPNWKAAWVRNDCLENRVRDGISPMLRHKAGGNDTREHTLVPTNRVLLTPSLFLIGIRITRRFELVTSGASGYGPHGLVAQPIEVEGGYRVIACLSRPISLSLSLAYLCRRICDLVLGNKPGLYGGRETCRLYLAPQGLVSSLSPCMQESLATLDMQILFPCDPTASASPDPSSPSGAQSLMVVSFKQSHKAPIRYLARTECPIYPVVFLSFSKWNLCLRSGRSLSANSFPSRTIGSASTSGTSIEYGETTEAMVRQARCLGTAAYEPSPSHIAHCKRNSSWPSEIRGCQARATSAISMSVVITRCRGMYWHASTYQLRGIPRGCDGFSTTESDGNPFQGHTPPPPPACLTLQVTASEVVAVCTCKDMYVECGFQEPMVCSNFVPHTIIHINQTWVHVAFCRVCV